jgi:hypothetical protein
MNILYMPQPQADMRCRAVARRTLVLLLLILSLVACRPKASSKGGPGSPGGVCTPPATASLQVNFHQQEAGNWCWAAASEMAMELMGNDVQQCKQANDAFGLDSCCSDKNGFACNKGGGPSWKCTTSASNILVDKQYHGTN